MFFCPSCIPSSFSPLAANFARSTISINVKTRNAIKASSQSEYLLWQLHEQRSDPQGFVLELVEWSLQTPPFSVGQHTPYQRQLFFRRIDDQRAQTHALVIVLDLLPGFASPARSDSGYPLTFASADLIGLPGLL